MVDLRGQLPTRPGAEPYYTRPLEGITGITIHYTAGGPYATPRDIALYQIGPEPVDKFPAIAYHLVVDHAGVLHLCHDLATRVWHSGAVVNGIARNRSHIGICYPGNYEPFPAQMTGLAAAVVWCERALGRTLYVEGHSDAANTLCPGPTWPRWRAALLGAVAGMRA